MMTCTDMRAYVHEIHICLATASDVFFGRFANLLFRDVVAAGAKQADKHRRIKAEKDAVKDKHLDENASMQADFEKLGFKITGLDNPSLPTNKKVGGGSGTRAGAEGGQRGGARAGSVGTDVHIPQGGLPRGGKLF